MSNYTINFESKQLTLLDSRFYTTPEEGWVPSVTTILQAYPKDLHFLKWLKENGEEADAIRDAAGRRGSNVHALTEQYDAGLEVSLITDEGRVNYSLEEWAMFERYVDFSLKHSPEIIQSEQNYVSKALGFAGTVDRIIKLYNETILVDIKTSNTIHPSYWLQLAAYRELLRANANIEVDKVAILWLNAKTRTEGRKDQIQGLGWQLITKADTDHDWELFKHTHALWLAQNKDITPRKLTYSLTHKK